MSAKIRLITIRDQIRSVPERWREQYQLDDGSWKYDGRVIYEKLCRLDLATCSPDDVTDAIGNPSWTDLPCSTCEHEIGGEGRYKQAVVQLDDGIDEGNILRLCRACAEAAFAAFDCRAHEDCALHPDTLGRACAAKELG